MPGAGEDLRICAAGARALIAAYGPPRPGSRRVELVPAGTRPVRPARWRSAGQSDSAHDRHGAGDGSASLPVGPRAPRDAARARAASAGLRRRAGERRSRSGTGDRRRDGRARSGDWWRSRPPTRRRQREPSPRSEPSGPPHRNPPNADLATHLRAHPIDGAGWEAAQCTTSTATSTGARGGGYPARGDLHNGVYRACIAGAKGRARGMGGRPADGVDGNPEPYTVRHELALALAVTSGRSRARARLRRRVRLKAHRGDLDRRRGARAGGGAAGQGGAQPRGGVPLQLPAPRGGDRRAQRRPAGRHDHRLGVREHQLRRRRSPLPVPGREPARSRSSPPTRRCRRARIAHSLRPPTTSRGSRTSTSSRSRWGSIRSS